MTRTLTTTDSTVYEELEGDEALTNAAMQGDEGALIELWRRHSHMSRYKLWRMMGNWQDIEDVMQETYLKSYLHLNQFSGRSKFSTWFMRIAINTALMKLRKRRSSHEVFADAGERTSRPIDFPDELQDTEWHYLRSECAGHLQNAIQRLQPALRNIFELKHDLDHSIEEIAEITGLSVSAVKSRLLRARLQLREYLAPLNRSRSSVRMSAQSEAQCINLRTSRKAPGSLRSF